MRIKVLLVLLVSLFSLVVLTQPIFAYCSGYYVSECQAFESDQQTCEETTYIAPDGGEDNCRFSPDAYGVGEHVCYGDEGYKCEDATSEDVCLLMGCGWTEENPFEPPEMPEECAGSVYDMELGWCGCIDPYYYAQCIPNDQLNIYCQGIEDSVECGDVPQCSWIGRGSGCQANQSYCGFSQENCVASEFCNWEATYSEVANTCFVNEEHVDAWKNECSSYDNRDDCDADEKCRFVRLGSDSYCTNNENFCGGIQQRGEALQNPEENCADPYCVWDPEELSYEMTLGQIKTLGEVDYVCMKNRPPTVDDNSVSLSYNSNANFSWRASDTFYHTIMSAFLPENQEIEGIQTEFATHFVSSGEQWFMCNASTFQVLNPDNSLNEFETFSGGTDTQITNLCSSVLKYMYSSQSVGFCQAANADECENKDDYFAFCFGSSEPVYESESFLSMCSPSCVIRLQRNLVNLQDFYSSNPDSTPLFCNNPQMRNEPECEGGASDIPPSCLEFSNQPGCKPSYELSSSCQKIQTDLGYSYSPSKNSCEEGSTCFGGDTFLNTANEICCIGASAACKSNEELQCSDVGQELPADYICGQGVVENIQGVNCCVGGELIQRPDLEISTLKNESFICYQQLEQDYIKECCEGNDCRQLISNNPLAGLSAHALTPTYSTTGGTLHDLQKIGPSRKSISIPSTESGLIIGNQFSLRDWSDFSQLRFSIFSYIPENLSLIIKSGETIVLDKSLTNYYVRLLGPSTATEVRVNLDELSSSTNITQVLLKNTANIASSVLVDNFYLVPNQNSDINSQLRYCSGKHRVWLENLDGQTSKGFWGQDNPDFDEYAPYEEACNAQPTNYWTGSVCCGNNPEGEGEYFVDTRGMCWNSIPISNNEIVKTQVGIADPTNKTQKLLYSNGKIYGCNISAEDQFLDINMAFGEGETGPSLASDEYFEEKDLFEVMQGYVCMPEEGWVDLANSNRMLIMASHLLNLVDDDYTLYCGDIMEVANYLPEHITSQPDLTQRACILRKGTSQEPEQTWVGLELNTILEVEEYSELVLKPFMPFSNTNITCEAGNINTPYSRCDGLNPLNMYGSDILGLVILSDKAINNENLVQLTGWQRLVNWIQNLLRLNQEEGAVLPNFGVSSRSIDDLYIAKKGGAEVRGTVSGVDAQKATRITIKGLSPQLGTLELLDLFRVLPEQNECIVNVKENSEVEVVIPGKFSNWKRTTGILRIQSQPEAATGLSTGIYNCSDFSTQNTVNLSATSTPNSEINDPGAKSSQGSVYFEDFESASINQNFFGSSFLTIKNNENNNYLQVRYTPNNQGSPRIIYQENIPSSQEYTLKYDVYFDEDFEFAKGGKLPGLTSEHPVWGCWDDTVDHGWSVRTMWRANGQAQIYYYDNERQAGDCGKSILANNFQFQKGRWYDIALRVKVNDNGQSNGEVELRIDNFIVASKQDIVFRKDNLDWSLINKFTFNTFFGGNDPTWAPSKEVYAYFDNLVVG